MYGQTTGRGAEALRGLETNYPVAMAYLSDAARAAEGGNDLRTRGGRLVRMGGGSIGDPDMDEADRGGAVARGRPRALRTQCDGAGRGRRVLQDLGGGRPSAPRRRSTSERGSCCACTTNWCSTCRANSVGEAATCLDDWLQEAAYRWLSGRARGAARRHRAVRFVADVSVIGRWSDAK